MFGSSGIFCKTRNEFLLVLSYFLDPRGCSAPVGLGVFSRLQLHMQISLVLLGRSSVLREDLPQERRNLFTLSFFTSPGISESSLHVIQDILLTSTLWSSSSSKGSIPRRNSKHSSCNRWKKSRVCQPSCFPASHGGFPAPFVFLD